MSGLWIATNGVDLICAPWLATRWCQPCCRCHKP